MYTLWFRHNLVMFDTANLFFNILYKEDYTLYVSEDY